MSTTNFTSGTVIASTWLNDVDAVTYKFDTTNADGASDLQVQQTLGTGISMTGGANVQYSGIIFNSSISAATPNSGLAETNAIRMNYTINGSAGTKMQVHMINGTLIVANDASTSGTEHAVILGTTRATGPIGSGTAGGVWGADFHVEKATSVRDGSMVGLEVGVHKAPAYATAKARGVDIWSGDRSGITATRAGDALYIHGDRGWTNFINCLYTDEATSIFKIDQSGNITGLSPTGNHTTTLTSNAATTNATLTIGGVTGGSVAVNAIIQATSGGQISVGSSTNHDVVLVQNNVECARFTGAGVSVGGATASSSTCLISAAGTTSKSSLRIPHGAAPTSPVNGDIWTTTAGLFVRINGATVGPLT